MKATEAKLVDFLRKSSQFVIPIYQRTYTWTAKECEQLWNDIIRSGNNDGVAVHFVGSIVYVESEDGNVSLQSPLLVIDGQQRLTSITLLLAALAEALESEPETNREPVDGFSPRKLRNYYLLNPEESWERHYKLLLSQTDKPTLISVVAGTEAPPESSIRILKNHQLFRDLLTGCNGDYKAVCRGLAKLIVVDVALKRGTDNPQLIFESMNSTGRKLSQADLIRNYILMGLEPNIQTRMYEQYWRRMELEFGQEAYGTNFDGFMRHYLTMTNGGDIPKLEEIYERFKAYAQPRLTTPAGVEGVVAELRLHAKYFCAMALGKEIRPELRDAFNDLRELRVDVAYPFLLELYHDSDSGLLKESDFLAIVRLIESYVFRRNVCAITPNSMNKTFANFTKSVDKSDYLRSVQAHFASLPSYRRFPEDREFRSELPKRDLYNIPRRHYWLRRLENHGRKELVSIPNYTVEHILPQNPKLSKEWRDELGPDWQRIQQERLHTLGNLTLTQYNPDYSDKPFAIKKSMANGLDNSPLNLNSGFKSIPRWDEAEIDARAARLTELALGIWPAPPTGAEPVSPSAAGVKDPRLQGVHRDLFEALSREVLALDPCVGVEFYKSYVAFKAETNFVDVEPQARRLLLTFNMPFPDVDDPKGLCKDVTELGHQGNGDVQLGVAGLADLPYAMSVVRQSFELQMDQSD